MINIKKISKIASIPSVSLFERPLLRYIGQYFRAPDHNRIITDRYAAFVSKDNKNDVLLTIHIDRLGLVKSSKLITYSNYYGYEHYSKNYKPNIVFGDRFLGKKVVAYHPTSGRSIGQGIVTQCHINTDDKLSFDIKGISWNLEQDPVPIGYQPSICLNKNRISGQIDNILAIYIGYLLLKNRSKFSIIFTSEEEIGFSWNFISNFLDTHHHSTVLVLDTTNIEHLIGLKDVDIVFRVSDDKAEFGQDLIEKLTGLANKSGIRYFLKTKNPDSTKIRTITEIGRLIDQSKHKIQGATVQLPSINYHTVDETTTVYSLTKTIQFLHKLEKIL